MFSKPTHLRAEIVSNVLTIFVSIGEEIKAGQTLLLLESMKMEIPVLSEIDGVVAEIPVEPGDLVQVDDLLIRLDEITENKK
ncbi:MAG: biotin/lipoyl-binding carrier protein [Actinomycetota bacterium]|jgi:biotin carboxyl carrier protein|nr:biotin/lipoyl-binding carrier protein [Actinomycetota bacterium]